VKSEERKVKSTPSLDGKGLGRVKDEANDILSYMRDVIDGIADLEARANAEMEAVTARYGTWLNPLRDELAAREKELTTLMKKNKELLFGGVIDVVNLAHGSLIRNLGDKVSIPKTALAECEKLKFDDVIKIVKSLDRDAIEKWPDAKLTLIGAQRKTKEEFKYTLKKEV
jgi:phage host-nuclease inhibitor protein Gam